MGRWSRLIHSDVLKMAGRTTVAPDIRHAAAARSQGLQANGKISVATDTGFSLGPEFLKKFVADTEAFGLTSYNLGGVATLQLLKATNLTGMRQSYLSLMAIPGHLLWRPDLGQRGYWVLKTCVHGALVVELTGPDAHHRFRLEPQAAEKPELLPITNPGGWKARKLTAVPPVRAPDGQQNEIIFQPDETGYSLLENSQCFCQFCCVNKLF